MLLPMSPATKTGAALSLLAAFDDCRCGEAVDDDDDDDDDNWPTRAGNDCLAISAASRLPPRLAVRDWSRVLGLLGALGYETNLPRRVLHAGCECVDHVLDFIDDELCAALALYGATLCHAAGRARCRACLATGHSMLLAAHLVAPVGRSRWAIALALIRVMECLGCATYDALRAKHDAQDARCTCAIDAWKWCRGQICTTRAAAVVRCGQLLADLHDRHGPLYLASVVRSFRPDNDSDSDHVSSPADGPHPLSGVRALLALALAACTPRVELPNAVLAIDVWAVGVGHDRGARPSPATEAAPTVQDAGPSVELSAYLPYVRCQLMGCFPASAASSPPSPGAASTADLPDAVLRSTGTFYRYVFQDLRRGSETWDGVSALDAHRLTQLCRTCFVGVMMSADFLGRPRVPGMFTGLVKPATTSVSPYTNSWNVILFLDDGDDAKRLLSYTEVGHSQGFIPPETDVSYCEGARVDVPVVHGDPADPAVAAHRYGLGLTVALASPSYGVDRAVTPCVEVAAFYRAVLWSRWNGCGGRDAHVRSMGWSYRRRPEPAGQERSFSGAAAPEFPQVLGLGLRPVAQRLITAHLVAWGNRLPSSHHTSVPSIR